MASRDFPLAPTPSYTKQDVDNYKGLVTRLRSDVKKIKSGPDSQQAKVDYLNRQDTLRKNSYYISTKKK